MQDYNSTLSTKTLLAQLHMWGLTSYSHVEDIHVRAVWINEVVWAHTTSLTPPLVIEMHVMRKEIGLSCICVLGVIYMCVKGHVYGCSGSCICMLGCQNALCFYDFLGDFWTALMVLYFFVIIFFTWMRHAIKLSQ